MQTHIDGLEEIVKNFDGVVDDIRRKPYDLLDFSNTQFDRDYMEFNVNIHELEMEIQVTIPCFYRIQSDGWMPYCRASSILVSRTFLRRNTH